jgi:hypothetical protein
MNWQNKKRKIVGGSATDPDVLSRLYITIYERLPHLYATGGLARQIRVKQKA